MPRLLDADASLADDLGWCEALVKRHSPLLHRTFRVLPTEKAAAIWAILAFHRRFAEAVDPTDDPEAFGLLRMQWTRFREGETPATHMWRALRWAAGRYRMERTACEAMIEGLVLDRDFRQPPDEAGLLRYCELVGGSLGCLLLPVFATGSVPDALETGAFRLGQAMRLAVVLRDVGEDLRMGRVRLPADRMAESGVTLSELESGRPTEGFRRLWNRYALIAEDGLASSLSVAHLCDPDSRRALRRAVLAYRAVLHEVRRHGGDCLSRRHAVPDWKWAVLSIASRFG